MQMWLAQATVPSSEINTLNVIGVVVIIIAIIVVIIFSTSGKD